MHVEVRGHNMHVEVRGHSMHMEVRGHLPGVRTLSILLLRQGLSFLPYCVLRAKSLVSVFRPGNRVLGLQTHTTHLAFLHGFQEVHTGFQAWHSES